MDRDGRQGWVSIDTCSRGCKDGACLYTSDCIDQCPELNVTGCQADIEVACLEGDGCQKWIPVSQCSQGCRDGKCAGTLNCSCGTDVCGDDGCGGSCGECGNGQVCRDGQCQVCNPDCAGKNCGDNGCGGSCGDCNDQQFCREGTCTEIPTGGKPYIVDAKFDLTPKNEFITCIAHLYGLELAGKPNHFLDPIVIKNPSDTTYTISVRAELQGYSDAASTMVTLAPGEEKTLSMDLTFDFAALYSVSAPVSSQATVELFESGSGAGALHSFSATVTIVPKNTMFWILETPAGEKVPLTPFVSVFATPHDKAGQISRLMNEAATISDFGAMLGYQYIGSTRESSFELVPGQCTPPSRAYYPATNPETGKPMIVGATVAVDSCFNCDLAAQYMILDQANYDRWSKKQSYNALLEWTTLGSGKQGVQVPSDGDYFHIACNPVSNYSNRTFHVERTRGLNEGAIDQIGALYWALNARGMNYSSVSADFFDHAQTIRFPSESLVANTANCIDGSLVFASALEALGMEPILVLGPGHAIVAVRIYPGSSSPIVVLDSTKVSAGDLDLALSTGSSFLNHWRDKGVSIEIPINDMRDMGITPAPM